MWKDTEHNSLNRLVWFSLDFGSSTWAKYNGEIYARDNENFNLTYSDYNQTIIGTVSSAYSYGQHSYNCDLPNGYVFVNNTGSGYINIQNPMEFHSIIVQDIQPVSLDLTVSEQATPVYNAQCILGGQIKTSGTDGICHFTNVPVNENATVYIQKGLTQRSVTVPIGDYYNSPISESGCGNGYGGQCSAFVDGNRTYKYSVDIEEPTVLVTVSTSFKDSFGDLYKINNATIYWDNIEKGSTDNGKLNFEVPHEYYPHTILITHSKTFNKTETVCLEDNPFFIGLTLKSGTNKEDVVSTDDELKHMGNYENLSDALLSPFVLGMAFLCIMMIIVVMLTGAIEIALVVGLVIMVGLVYFGALPIWFGLILIILTALAGFLMFGGVFPA